MKLCLGCRQAKPATEDHYTLVKGAPTPRCKSCVAAAENERAKYLQRLYGLSKDDYASMLLRQGGVCAICGRSPEVQRRRLGVDHDHRTGQIRGLLCSACNAGIAGLREDPELFAAALRYLGRFRDVESAAADEASPPSLVERPRP